MKNMCIICLCLLCVSLVYAEEMGYQERIQRFQKYQGRENKGTPYFSAKGFAVSSGDYTIATINLTKRNVGQKEQIVGMLVVGDKKYMLKLDSKTDSTATCSVYKMNKDKEKKPSDDAGGFFNEGEEQTDASRTDEPILDSVGSISLSMVKKYGQKLGSGKGTIENVSYTFYVHIMTKQTQSLQHHSREKMIERFKKREFQKNKPPQNNSDEGDLF